MADAVGRHLDAGALVEAIEGTTESEREHWIRHLSECCGSCWQVLRSGMPVRILVRLPQPDDPSPPPGPTAFSLCRLLAYHAPETPGRTRAEVLRPLYPRHRDALRTAHERRGGFLRLLLEESQLELPYELVRVAHTSRLELVRSFVELIPCGAEYEDLRAWGQAGLARAAHRQGAAGEQVREHVRQAESHAGRGAGDLLLAVTLRELASLPANEAPRARTASLDQALAMLAGNLHFSPPAPQGAWHDLGAELLLAKARCLVWQPENASRVCRQALELLGPESPPRLRLEILDQLAAAQLGLARTEEARASWLEAQRWSELAGEEPVEYCRRWADLARASTPGAASPGGSAAERAAAYRAAIWGYRSLRFHDDAARLLAEHARLERRRQQ